MSVVMRGREKGYFTVENKIFECDGLNIYEKVVYMYLCRRADSQGKSFPSYDTIARDCSCSRRKVIDAIKYLEKMGLVVKLNRITSQGDPNSNIYFVFPPDKPFNELTENITELIDASILASLGVVHDMHHPRGSARHALGWCTTCTRVVHDMHPKDNHIKDTHLRTKEKQQQKEKVVVDVVDDNFIETIMRAISTICGATVARTTVSKLIIASRFDVEILSGILLTMSESKQSGTLKNPGRFLRSAGQAAAKGEYWTPSNYDAPFADALNGVVNELIAENDKKKQYDALLMG